MADCTGGIVQTMHFSASLSGAIRFQEADNLGKPTVNNNGVATFWATQTPGDTSEFHRARHLTCNSAEMHATA